MKWLATLADAARTVRAALIVVALTLGALIEHVAEPVATAVNSVSLSKSWGAEQQSPLLLSPLGKKAVA